MKLYWDGVMWRVLDLGQERQPLIPGTQELIQETVYLLG